MARARKMNVILLVMTVVVLAATATVLFVTHPAEARETRFWTTLGFIGLALLATFALSAGQNVLPLDGGATPLPLYMGLGSIVFAYDAFVIAVPLLLWKGLDLSATTYVLVHIVGVAFFLVLAGAGLMTLMASKGRAEENRSRSLDWSRRSDEAEALARRARSRDDDETARAWEEGAQALRYADPVGTASSFALEERIDGILARALEADGADEPDLARDLEETVRQRNALLRREK